MSAATVVQVLYVLLQLLVMAAISGFKFYRKFYCMFCFTCDRSLSRTYSEEYGNAAPAKVVSTRRPELRRENVAGRIKMTRGL